MRMLVRLVFLVALIAAAVWLWRVFFPTPEKIIRTELQEIAASASFGLNDGTLAPMVNAEKLASHFAPDAKVHVDAMETGEHSLTGRDEIAQAAYAARSQFSTLKVKFQDINVSLGADGESASAELTARVDAHGQDDFIISEMRFSFKKIDGQWLIVRVESVKPLS